MGDDVAIVKRLDVIIRLLLEQQTESGQMKRHEQLLLMESIGLTSTEIGKILNQEPKNISSQINKIKKSKKSTPKNQ